MILSAQQYLVVPDVKSQRPRRLQLLFSLRLLLSAVAVIGIGLGWLSHTVFKGRRQAAAVAAIAERPGGQVYYAHQFAFRPDGPPISQAKLPGHPLLRRLFGEQCFLRVVEVSGQLNEQSLTMLSEFRYLDTLQVSGEGIDDSSVRRIAELDSLRGLNVGAANLSDAGVDAIAQLPHLEWLWISDSRLTDEGLRHLTRLPELRELSIWNDSRAHGRVRGNGLRDGANLPRLEQLFLKKLLIEDDALRYLARCTNLQVLTLADTRVSGEGLAHLAGLHRLWALDLSESPVRDEAVAHLRRLRGLRVLGLVHTSLSARAIDELRIALPACELNTDGPRAWPVRLTAR